jgi:hypothetical protein
MINGVSLETCWAFTKQWNIKFYYTVASCWLFLYDFYYDARIHEHHIYWEYLRLGAFSKHINLQNIFLIVFSKPNLKDAVRI